MSRFSTRGQLDDAIIPNGDGGFIKFDTRIHPTQLKSGTVRFAQNTRFDNNIATVRTGIDRISADLLVAGDPLFLPFGLGTEVSLASITEDSNVATATLSATPVTAYTNGDTIEIQGATPAGYNGTFTLTYVSDTVFTYPVTGPLSDATGTLTASPVIGDAVDGVFASCRFSDVDTNNEYIAQATLDKVILLDPDDISNTIDIPYAEASATAVEEQLEQTDSGAIIQVGNGLLINRGKLKKALEWDGNIFNVGTASVASMTRSGGTVTVNTDVEHDYRTGDIITIAGSDQGDYNGDQTITITDTDTFTFATTSAQATTATGTITATKIPQFSVVADTQQDDSFLSMPQAEFSEYHPLARLIVPVRVLFIDVTSITQLNSVVTVTTTLNHGLLVGDRITVEGASGIEFNGVHEITKRPTLNTFEYVIEGASISPDPGTSIQVKLDTRDQFIFSDIYDHRTYDPVNNLFRINRGKDDSLVALKTFQNDNTIALYDKSVHIVTGVSLADLNLSSVFKITDEVGCIARKTVEIIGTKIVFLSEQGVYMLDITPELNLRGREVPLSRDIQDQFTETNLNYSYISASVAVYFNNRYYIAVPSSGSTRNDVVYIFNFINGGWESKDTFGSANYIDNWVVCRKSGKDRLFATSLEGSIQLWEELDHDELGSSPTNTEIPLQLITRRYTMGNTTDLTSVTPFSPLQSNRFMRGRVNLDVLNGDVMTITANTENPDSTVQVASYTFTATEDHLKSFRINKRGTGCEIQIDSTVGRPTIRSILIEGTETQRGNKNTE